MSDVKTVKIELPDALEEPAKALSMPLATNVGTTIGDLWFLAFGGISQKAALKRAKYANALEKYKADLEKKLNEIPEERRIEPNTQVVLNALTASQSCVEEESLREMFANLIASASDSEKADAVHPAFPGIIKQMSSFDARLFQMFADHEGMPLVNIILNFDENGFVRHKTNIFIPDTQTYSAKEQSSTAECLRMLGLVEISFKATIFEPEIYTPFESLPELIAAKDLKTIAVNSDNNIQEIKSVEIERGSIYLTDFGKRFLAACA